MRTRLGWFIPLPVALTIALAAAPATAGHPYTYVAGERLFIHAEDLQEVNDYEGEVGLVVHDDMFGIVQATFCQDRNFDAICSLVDGDLVYPFCSGWEAPHYLSDGGNWDYGLDVWILFDVGLSGANMLGCGVLPVPATIGIVIIVC